MTTAERNRLLKSLLTKAFAPHTVTVKGSRGTAYGWLTIKIAYAPRDRDERDALNAKIWEIIRAAKIEIGSYGYDDPGSDYGHGRCIHINFEALQYERRFGVEYRNGIEVKEPQWTPESARAQSGGTFGT